VIKTLTFPDKKTWAAELARYSSDSKEIKKTVKEILRKVKKKGDKAVKNFTEEFDGVRLKKFFVTREEIKKAESEVSEELKEAIKIAAENIEKFHLAQKSSPVEIETMPGVRCMRKSVPIEKIGLYIPGGSAPLFSSVLMLGIPANIAGCDEIILCTPCNKFGEVNPVVLYTAQFIGIDKIAKIGGAQAIAAMAFGTKSIPQVHKIFGPGNRYVTIAKQLISKDGVAIDMPAGPSELLVYADETCVPAFVAADLLSQAEHGPDSQVVLVSQKQEVINAVKAEIDTQLELLPRRNIASKALHNSRLVLVKTQEDAIELINFYAPEHLILAIRDFEKVSDRVVNAGSIFLGNYSPESAGDYASGTNHTLPTYGYAKAYSGVSLDSFVKKITYQHITEEGMKLIGPTIEKMAEAEGLFAHKNAVTLRLEGKVTFE
jgi:histidinol dehydrogenase